MVQRSCRRKRVRVQRQRATLQQGMAHLGTKVVGESPSLKREPLKFSAGKVAAQRRRQHAVTIGKERREAILRTKRLCRDGVVGDNEDQVDAGMILDEEGAALDAQTNETVGELKSALRIQGKDALRKKLEVLRTLRCLLSKSTVPPVETAVQAGVVPLLVECLSFGSPDEQRFGFDKAQHGLKFMFRRISLCSKEELLEAAWCLTNIAAGEAEQTKALLPALPLLVAHLGDRSSVPIAEQCAWALGNVAGEGEELRNILIAQGALPALARMMLSDNGSMARTAAWALSNLIKGPHPWAATELIKINGALDAIIRHMKKADDELATEVAWVVVYLTALSNSATSLLVNSDLVQLLVGRLAASECLQLLIPVLRSIGNLVACDSHVADEVLAAGYGTTDNVMGALVKCLSSDHRVLKKEAAWVLSNIAAGSLAHKQLIYFSDALPLLLHLLSTAPFDIRKEVAYALGNVCVVQSEGSHQPNLILDHLVSLVDRGCLPGFISLVRSPDLEAARLGLQFLEMVMRGLPNGRGPKLVEREDGIDAMERFQFHENEHLRSMANELVDKYFGEDHGHLDED
ncbi:importin subunit alpha-9 isoform X3 [Amborella trichopoda]|uniref:importin subunit alpha-9 isoform X3 n=1 Tax=Amborella trichopoda TaxID=13333 RepID=UPI0009BCBEFD|nr:importin subunit alpha-9 isoform X3 [Amborella trichopoda]|eukprot:XP_020518750.1 importin subunit alpha-9 isoform X3 [Amborella trichopoda]